MAKDKYVQGDVYPTREDIARMPRSFSKHVFAGRAMPIVKCFDSNESILVGIEFKKTGRFRALNYAIKIPSED